MISEHSLGKIPPQSIEMESAVLGCVLLEIGALNKVSGLLRPECFYRPEHQVIYKAVLQVHNRGEVPDILTVVQQCRTNGELETAGGAAYISQLTTQLASTANVDVYSRLVVQDYLKRELIRIGITLTNDAYDNTTDCFDLIDKANREITGILTTTVKPDAAHVSEMAKPMLDDISKRASDTNYIHGVPFFLAPVDKVIGGLSPGDFMVIGARPGMGKTAFIISAAVNQAQRGYPVLVFSLEMTKEQLTYRIISILTGINLEKLMKGRLTTDEINDVNIAWGRLEKLPIWIDDSAALDVYALRSIAQRIKDNGDIKAVYIDYIQLVTVKSQKGQNREQDIGEISRTLKRTAKELGVPVVALSQLSRQVEARADKRPILSDLRESGSIEQDTDVVSFLYRPEYYGVPQTESGEPSHGVAEFIVAKHRNGSCRTAVIGFRASCTQFYDKNSYEQPKETPHPDSRIEPNKDFLVDETPF